VNAPRDEVIAALVTATQAAQIAAAAAQSAGRDDVAAIARRAVIVLKAGELAVDKPLEQEAPAS
jgi:hypothetical protein